ncbi:MAG TPA: hypothetical protein VFO34_02795 [Candidatus Acidoferrales bacterium]|nr:hypothetical protein [Candidatus Acidoferrales bacterium]
MLRDFTIGAKIAVQIFRLIGLPLLTEVVERPKKPFGGVSVYCERLLIGPFIVTKTQEDEVFAVRANAEEAAPGAIFLTAKIVEALLELVYEFAVGCGVFRGGEIIRLFVFDDDALIDRVRTASGDGDVVMAIEFDLRAAGKIFERADNLDLEIHFGFGPSRSFLDLIGENYGAIADNFVEGFGLGPGRHSGSEARLYSIGEYG